MGHSGGHVLDIFGTLCPRSQNAFLGTPWTLSGHFAPGVNIDLRGHFEESMTKLFPRCISTPGGKCPKRVLRASKNSLLEHVGNSFGTFFGNSGGALWGQSGETLETTFGHFRDTFPQEAKCTFGCSSCQKNQNCPQGSFWPPGAIVPNVS